jgi:hypothetical protein
MFELSRVKDGTCKRQRLFLDNRDEDPLCTAAQLPSSFYLIQIASYTMTLGKEAAWYFILARLIEVAADFSYSNSHFPPHLLFVHLMLVTIYPL